MGALTLIAVNIGYLFHLTSAMVSSSLSPSSHNSLSSLYSIQSNTPLSSASSRQNLSNVSIDVRSLILALVSVAAILISIPPLFTFFAELFRRLGKNRGAYDRVDSSDYDYDYDSGTSRGW